MKRKGKKDDSQKPNLELIPIEFIIGIAKAFSFGMRKYGTHNFRKGLEYASLLAAAIRHTFLELAGVDVDDDSGLPHWALAGASLAMYSWMRSHKPNMDNRYKYDKKQLEAIVEMMYGKTTKSKNQKIKRKRSNA